MWDATREKVFKTEKRDILVDRVSAAKSAQEDTQEVFQDALEQFSAVVGFDGGDLEKEYRKMEDIYTRCHERALALDERIDNVERVSKALFKEWKAEIKEYENRTFAQDSEKKLRETETQCDRMISAMRNAESKINPVLRVFKDQVLFLKHNLNAAAIASLGGQTAQVETDVKELLAEMNEAIAEADRFIARMAAP